MPGFVGRQSVFVRGLEGDKEMGRQGDGETRRQGDKEMGRQGDGERTVAWPSWPWSRLVARAFSAFSPKPAVAIAREIACAKQVSGEMDLRKMR